MSVKKYQLENVWTSRRSLPPSLHFLLLSGVLRWILLCSPGRLGISVLPQPLERCHSRSIRHSTKLPQCTAPHHEGPCHTTHHTRPHHLAPHCMALYHTTPDVPRNATQATPRHATPHRSTPHGTVLCHTLTQHTTPHRTTPYHTAPRPWHWAVPCHTTQTFPHLLPGAYSRNMSF